MRSFLHKLQEKGFNLENLNLYLWINKYQNKRAANKEDFVILKEKALDFLERTTKSHQKINTSLGL